LSSLTADLIGLLQTADRVERGRIYQQDASWDGYGIVLLNCEAPVDMKNPNPWDSWD
jgi:hypothetical protein